MTIKGRVLIVAAVLAVAACASVQTSRHGLDARQTPGWSAGDEQDFLYGSMGNEFVPERVLRAFFRTYPDLFPGGSLAAFGALPAPGREWPVGAAAAARGATHYRARCASCHDDVPEEQRVHAVEALGTDPNRARFFDRTQAERTNAWRGRLTVKDDTPDTSAYRSTGKYWAPELDAAWARSPYLHNGSVRTMWDRLQPPARRPVTFRRGSRVLDLTTLGFVDEGPFVFDTRISGNSNAGHDYGTDLGDGAKRDLIEYLKTR